MQLRYSYIAAAAAAAALIFLSGLLFRPLYRADRSASGIHELSVRMDDIEAGLELIRERMDAELVLGAGTAAEAGAGGMEHALSMLGSSDPLVQYRAARTLRGYGDDAAGPLADAISREGSGGAMSRALVLTSIGGEKAGEKIYELADSMLSENGGDGRTLALLLGELARRRHPESAPLFRRGLQSDSEPVRLASVSGIRRMSDMEAMEHLVLARKRSGRVTVREVDRTVNGMLLADPEGFRDVFSGLIPENRFELVRLFLSYPGRDQLRFLEAAASADPDPRVSEAAGRAVELMVRRDAEAVHRRRGVGDEVESVRELLRESLGE